MRYIGGGVEEGVNAVTAVGPNDRKFVLLRFFLNIIANVAVACAGFY